MKRIHNLQFPRFHDDIMSERRTLFHVPLDEHVWKTGDGLRLLSAPNFPRCKIGILTSVRQVRLRAELDADFSKLAVMDPDEYLARWDLLHPELPSSGNPGVWRIEFCYGPWEVDPSDPPEWSLVS
jgi:hypothetical protein